MSSTTAHHSSFAFPRTAVDWIHLRDFLFTTLLVPKSHRERNTTWAVFSLLGVTAVLYILAVSRALYLKKYYLVKRDSFRRLCPHSCLLISFCDLVYITLLLVNLALQEVHSKEPFPISKLVLDQSWGVWCAMPPVVVQLPKFKISWWHSHGPWIILIFLIGHFLTCLTTAIPLLRHLARIRNLWTVIRFRLDVIVKQAISPEGIAPSPRNFKFESQTLLLVVDLKMAGDLFLKHLRQFSTGVLCFTIVMAAMFFYASITILRALDLQLKLIEEVLHQGSSASYSGREPSDMPMSMRQKAKTKLSELKQNLSWKTVFDLLRTEKLDYDFDRASINQGIIVEQESVILQKASRLRRHWWRIFLQLIVVSLLAVSYCALALCVAANYWKIGDERFLTQIEHKLDEWKIWTWLSGPGIMLATITCVSEFLEEGKDGSEPDVVKPQLEALKDTSPDGSLAPESNSRLHLHSLKY
ncbi:hypothetical protein CROQUDRAFT_99653 [Cronartium quercuum f. sp. fusiforme G11]|uniref:Uncharacterized protein n=1 Tax=Cronartium quercuum f. sp. fusiforme G11 TaxID=708437 RepID=A0A9P6T697_9BASI|nr:hypothetical protein CROQUDRAFT_99653 [Cronartium quercuum f. sp. fusiforme G11]